MAKKALVPGNSPLFEKTTKRDEIIAYILGGNTYRNACGASGINKSTSRNWELWGEAARQKVKDDEELVDNEQSYIDFLDLCDAAHSKSIAKGVETQNKHGAVFAGANQWMLAHQEPETYGDSRKVDIKLDGPLGEEIDRYAAETAGLTEEELLDYIKPRSEDEDED